ncbi:response regulator transcription factor [Starkeya sp. ORNL1]|uniref:response regulator transcription factor n=1 Tax=Starkeya sp. ORNL1 TaxID=2709380 RepID=UPI0014635B7B|nr:response regulator transcription factor [Starkeya sp. ORNL1]QJP12532.1 response regulator transcription factor [Starkeya sp. ORNL1]
MQVDQQLQRRSTPLSPQWRSEAEQPLVIIVDDDTCVREALFELILSAGLQPACFASINELLHADVMDSPGCMILDVRLPGASGLDLQHHLAKNGNPKPIIFLTGHGDIPMTVQAMKAGAIDFLTKPARDQALLDAVLIGIERDVARRATARIARLHLGRYKTLTPRERQVMGAVALGRLNKQIAFDLNISEVTVKLHRSNVMRKMELTSVGELIRLWEALPAEVRERVEA